MQLFPFWVKSNCQIWTIQNMAFNLGECDILWQTILLHNTSAVKIISKSTELEGPQLTMQRIVKGGLYVLVDWGNDQWVVFHK